MWTACGVRLPNSHHVKLTLARLAQSPYSTALHTETLQTAARLVTEPLM